VKDTDRAYIAGLVDGEGCIAITRRKLKKLKNDKWYYEPQVIISNTKKDMVNFCVSHYGGWIASAIGRIGNRDYKRIYHWKITGEDMRQLLREVLPYLILKRRQARIVLHFPCYRYRGRYKRTKIELNQQERRYKIMRKLNNRRQYLSS